MNDSSTPGASSKKFDLIGIAPYDPPGNEDSVVDLYSCYAGNSFPKTEKVKTVGLNEMNKCAMNSIDDTGAQNEDFEKNMKTNTVMYKIDTEILYDNKLVSFLGCFKKNIPELAVYNTLPHFIGSLTGISFMKSNEIMNKCSKLVKDYNESMNTNYDIFGITSNPNDTITLDCYAGTYGFDSKYAMHSKNDSYNENCNIYYPGEDNFMIFQDIDQLVDPCLPKSVSHLEKYNDLMTDYINVNVKQQQQTISDIGTDLNILNELFPVKFSISKIANTNDNALIQIDKNPLDDESGVKMCNLNIMVKQGPKGEPGDKGDDGIKGGNTKGSVGNMGNSGYWGKTK
jgi:hypothetical protein